MKSQISLMDNLFFDKIKLIFFTPSQKLKNPPDNSRQVPAALAGQTGECEMMIKMQQWSLTSFFMDE